MSNIPPTLPTVATSPAMPSTSTARSSNRAKGFFPPRIVRAVSFYIISLCIVASVIVCILAIWDFTKKDSLWRLIASFLVVAAGTALFAFINGIFGDEKDL